MGDWSTITILSIYSAPKTAGVFQRPLMRDFMRFKFPCIKHHAKVDLPLPETPVMQTNFPQAENSAFKFLKIIGCRADYSYRFCRFFSSLRYFYFPFSGRRYSKVADLFAFGKWPG